MMELWRKGVPSIGETWPRRFHFRRSTGGLGAGVYTFRTESAATRNNEDRRFGSSEIYRLENAVENPIQPRTRDATQLLNDFSRKLALVAAEVRSGEVSWEYVEERGASLRLTLTGGFGGQPRVDDGNDSLGHDIIPLLGDIPELRETWGYDSDGFVQDAIQAAKAANRDIDRGRNSHGTQPLNHLLYPEYDGVCPHEGAGGDSGKWGCVVLLERVQECVDREFTYSDEIEAATLNDCFGGP
jgi:hypothetical protein